MFKPWKTGVIIREALPLFVKEVHSLLDLVVGCHTERNDLHRGQSWRHGEDFAPVRGLIQILLGLRVGHSSWIATHNVEIGAGNHAGPAMPLHLPGGAKECCQ